MVVREEGRVRCLIIGMRNPRREFNGFQFLGMLLFDFMDSKGILQMSQNCSEVSKYFAKRAAISGVTLRFPCTISDGRSRDMQLNRQPVRRDAHRLQELFTKNLSRMNYPIANFRLATLRKFEGGIPWLLPVSQDSFVLAPCSPPTVLITERVRPGTLIMSSVNS